MLRTKGLSKKVFVIGLDAMDPKLTRKYVDMGLMPNVKKIIDHGSAREDLVLLGSMPTVTPPQWTTLATGVPPEVHEITAFFSQGKDLDLVNLNFDSGLCKAEQLWNVTAEAGFKTLVWHWPGSAWPPSSDSPNLHVVDGTSPGSVNMSTAQFEEEMLVIADPKNQHTGFKPHATSTAEVPCVVTGLDEEPQDDGESGHISDLYEKSSDGFPTYIIDPLVDGQGGYIDIPVNASLSTLKDVDQSKWANAPETAKEFTILLSGGLIRRPALVLQNDDGKYDKIAIYKNKKSDEPLIEAALGEYVRDYVDEGIKNDKRILCNRDFRVLEIKEDGSYVKIWMSAGMQIDMDMMWSPQSLHKEILDNIGFPPPTSTLGGSAELISKCMHACWEHTLDWQSGALNYLIENHDYDVIFSHFHSPDLQKHMFIRDMVHGRPDKNMSPEVYPGFMEDVYTQIDRYVAKFVHLLDEGWTLIITSDHAQVCPTHGIRGLGDSGANIQLMEELGYTTLKKDSNGNKLREMDWDKTLAVANREMHIYLNLKGRTDHGIVDPEDQYELEEKIISDLYSHRDPVTGKRIIAFAFRRKDAHMLGLGIPYPQGGDIIYCMAEGYEHDHCDSMATSTGECDTSAGPIFIAAGAGIKEGFVTSRTIHQVDVAPTIATLLGVRMPRECEGAPVYQILTEEF